MKRWSTTILSSSLIISLFTLVHVNAETNGNTEKAIVFFDDKDSVNNETLEKVGDVEKTFSNLTAAVVEVSPDNIDELSKLPGVETVEMNQKIHINEEPNSVKQISSINSSALSLTWALDHTKAKEAWTAGYNGTGVKVAVADSGIDLSHPDLHYAGGKSFITDTKPDGSTDTSLQDYYGHGTHVAGLINAKNDGIGTTGISPGASLYVLKILNYKGEGTTVELLSAIDWALQNHMDILNLSIGSQSGFSAFQQAVDQAYQQGLLIVSAAGNDFDKPVTDGGCNNDFSKDCVDFPANYSSVIGVGAIGQDNSHASFSSIGPSLEVTAPGVDVASTYLNSSYAYMSGTSMAAPITTGVLALYKQKYPNATAEELRQLLINTAVDLGSTGRDNIFGYGYVQMNINAKLPTTNQAPVLTKAFSNINVDEGGEVVLNLADYFKDTDGDSLTYTIANSKTTNIQTTISNGKLTIKGLKAYNNIPITVAASDGKSKIRENFYVTINQVPVVAYNNYLYLIDKTSLYNESTGGTAITILSPQTIFATNRKGGWFEVKTSLGLKWIHPTKFVEGQPIYATKRIVLTQRESLYNSPLDSDITSGSLSLQTVYSKMEWNGWYLISTWAGDKWIKPVSPIIDSYVEIVNLKDRAALYTSPDESYKTGASLNLQSVYAYEKRGQWYKVNTWLGYRWIKPTSFTITKPQPLNDYVPLTQKANIYELPNGTLSGSVAPQQLYAYEKMNNWYYIKTWLGKRWVYIA